ncbi:TPA: CBS domain-containing protein, partial [archaeon]|nr:CBS domain-containing protein [Candidatus Naiadarchaeales archaeon SRR2090153.bin1042]
MDIKSKIPVQDAMTSRVITASPDATLEDIAKLMLKHDIGGVVIEKKGEPLGIVTEKDFTNVISKGKNPLAVKAGDAMSSPLITIDPEQSILDAARLMTKKKVRKLPVKSKGKLIGIITAEDIVRVAPKEIELLLELASIKAQDVMESAGVPEEFAEKGSEGECEICGNYSDYLYHLEDGTYVCGEC